MNAFQIIVIVLLLTILAVVLYNNWCIKQTYKMCSNFSSNVTKLSPTQSPTQSPTRSPTRSPTPININGLDGTPKDWIFMLKLGTGGANCTINNGAYSCHFLYADSENPTVKLVTEFTVDSTDPKNPAYQFYQLCQNNTFVTWNDQGSIKSCAGASGYAHDKGGIVYNSQEGIYCQSSNPNWGFFDKGFLDAGTASHPGIQTGLAQHLLFVKLNSQTDISNMVSLMNQANVCIMDGHIDGFNTCIVSGKCTGDYLSKNIGSLTVIAKPKGIIGDDAWGQLNKMYCGGVGMHVLSFCTPDCPLGTGKPTTSINGIIDVKNDRNNPKSILNTTCTGLSFDSFSSNHSKIGSCDNNNKVIVGGNNHSTATQGARGGLFVVIDNQKFSDGIKCLFR